MRIIKKAVLILLALCMALPISALSEGVAQTYGDYTYSVPYGTYAVILSYDGSSSVVDIPETIEGLPVESISSSAFDACREEITDLTIPGTVKKFSSAFRGCVSLTNVTLREGVTAIGADAFNGCSALTEVILPESLTAIGANAFRGCSSLVDLSLPAGVTQIGTDAFADCPSLSGVNLPKEKPDAVQPQAAAAEEPHVHQWQLTKTTATCIASGEAAYTCSVCKKIELRRGEPLGHAFRAVFNEETGRLTLSCTRCAVSVSGEKITGSRWQVTGEAATVCAQRGYHVCRLIDRTATCYEDGESESIVCSSCGVVLQGAQFLGKRNHWWRDWVLVDEGTCCTPRILERTCRHCSYKEQKTDGYNCRRHVRCQWVSSYAPTCVAYGSTGYLLCRGCNTVVRCAAAIAPTGVHTYSTTGVCVYCKQIKP
ncbi:MAG: leucine-rich repeat domain-containing protein [Clostridia bacterium]|nr:leucine-rich repeat domain-containing protein [Clostridia bacterium]